MGTRSKMTVEHAASARGKGRLTKEDVMATVGDPNIPDNAQITFVPTHNQRGDEDGWQMDAIWQG